jgi:hypothetical protein
VGVQEGCEVETGAGEEPSRGAGTAPAATAVRRRDLIVQEQFRVTLSLGLRYVSEFSGSLAEATLMTLYRAPAPA